MPEQVYAQTEAENTQRETGRVRRFRLQSAAGELLPLESVARCLKYPRKQLVEGHYHPKTASASFSGLARCGSVWHCPVCAAKIAERRKEELAGAVAAHEEKGGRVVMVTYTVRHRAEDGLKGLLRGLLGARRRMRSGRKAKAWADGIGLVGSIRAVEVTHGENGWHPHVHELLFLEGAANLEALEAAMSGQWVAAVQAEGLSAVAGVALKVSFDLTQADYLAKFGCDRQWGPEHELTRTMTKKAYRGGRSPWQLLAAFGEAQDEDAGRLFVEYADAFKGCRQLWWSKGLKGRCGVLEVSDAELVEDQRGDGELMITFRKPGWKWIVGNDCRGELLDVIATGKRVAVADFVRRLGVPDEWWWVPIGEEEQT